eukprot:COSAG02_NODE_6846_length_3329_cov_6.995356_3_plen_237_part_00
MRLLCNSGLDLLHAVDSDGNTVLHTAARRGHPQMMHNLLQRCELDEMWCMCSHSRWAQAWLEQGDANNETALHLAARHGHTRAVAALLHSGASAASLSLRVDRLGGTALHSAVSKRRHGAIQSILGHFVHGNKSMHRTLLQLLDHRNVNGYGALGLAVQEGDALAVLLMLRARGILDRQRRESDARKASLEQECSDSASGSASAIGLEADVHVALRWAALSQPQVSTESIWTANCL